MDRAATTLELPQRNRMPVERIIRHGDDHGVAVARLTLDAATDRDCLYTCPTLAPLAHTPIHAELTDAQQRRYNQLVGLLQNELICFFEQEFAGGVLPALLRRSGGMAIELVETLRRFLDEEREHTRMFRRLNRLAEPDWYRDGDYHVLRLPGPFLRVLRTITRRPMTFPMVFWIMLMMEERSLMISRRYAKMEPLRLDPQFAQVYSAHAEDEVRHVQTDWHLLEQFYSSRPMWLRRINARLLEWLIVGLFLRPRRANVRLVDLLIESHPELNAMRSRLVAAVYSLEHNPGYRQMMYSAESTPIARGLFERLPEFARLRRRLFAEGGGT